MDLYKKTVDYLSGLPFIEAWSEMLSMVQTAAIREPYGWRLPVLSCEAVGGTSDQAVPAPAAMACLQMSIIHVDDMLDADPRGLYHKIGMPATANMAVGFQAAGIEAIARSTTSTKVKLAIFRSLNMMVLATAFGQYLDTQDLSDEASYWRLVELKSSPFFGASLEIGALLGSASTEMTEMLRRFGCLYGEIIQIHDDLNDAMLKPANPDWTLERPSLPILYALTVSHSDQARFRELRHSAHDPDALTEAQTILIRSGAVSYCIDQVLHRYRKLRQLLTDLSLNNADRLEPLLESAVTPVEALFATVGVIHVKTVFGL